MFRETAVRVAIVVQLVVGMAGCEGSGGSENQSAEESVDIVPSERQISVEARLASGERFEIPFEIVGFPPEHIQIRSAEAPHEAIAFVGIDLDSRNTGIVTIITNRGAGLKEGKYHEQVDLIYCIEPHCFNPEDFKSVGGDPITVSVNVEHPGSVSISSSEIAVFSTAFFEPEFGKRPESLIQLSIDGVDPALLHSSYDLPPYASSGIESVIRVDGARSIELAVQFLPGSFMGEGMYTGDASINICYDRRCSFHVEGSPFTVNSSYHVSTFLPANVPTVSVVSRTPFPVDVISAVYSESLDSIAFISSTPENALYVYDISNGGISKIGLPAEPTAISVDAADTGMQFAVGHVDQVSVIDYDPNLPDESGQKVLEVDYYTDTEFFGYGPAETFGLANHRGYVYAIPATGGGKPLFIVSVEDNSITYHQSNSESGAGRTAGPTAYLTVHPDGRSIYSNGLNRYFAKYGIESNAAFYEYQYYVNTAKRVWINRAGDKIYSSAGDIFALHREADEYIEPVGELPIHEDVSSLDYNEIVSLAEPGEEGGLLGLVRPLGMRESRLCHRFSEDIGFDAEYGCITQVVQFDSSSYIETSRVGFPGYHVDGEKYLEEPVFITFNSDKSRVFAITKIFGVNDPMSFIVELEY